MNYRLIQIIAVRRLNFYCITLEKYCHCIFCKNDLSTKVWTTFVRYVWIDDVWNYIIPSTCFETVRIGAISDLQLGRDGQNWNYIRPSICLRGHYLNYISPLLVSDGQNWIYDLQLGEDLQNCWRRSVLELYQTFILLKAASLSALQHSIFGRRKINL